MNLHTTPKYFCPRCSTQMAGIGSTGLQDICKCPTCGKTELFVRQERRGSVRKKAEDEPYEVTACSGEIDDYRLSYAHRMDKLQCTECGIESELMDTYHPTDGWCWWGIGCCKSPHCRECAAEREKEYPGGYSFL